MAQSAAIETVVNESYDKIQGELQTKGNLLQNIFVDPKDFDTKKKNVRFIGSVDPIHDIDVNETQFNDALRNAVAAPDAARGNTRGLPTPARTPFTFRNRLIRSASSKIHVESARAEAQILGLLRGDAKSSIKKDNQTLMEIKKIAVEKALRRASLLHILDLITQEYREGNAAGTGMEAVPVPTRQYIITPYQQRPGTSGAGDRGLRELAPEDIYWLNAEIDNAVGLGDKDGLKKLRPGFEKVKRLFILSHSGWRDFSSTSYGLRDQVIEETTGTGASRVVEYLNPQHRGRNTDIKDIYIKGYGTFPSIDGTLFVTIPDEFLMDPVARPASGTAPRPGQEDSIVGWAATAVTEAHPPPVRGQITGTGNPLANGISTVGLHRGIMLDPRAFSLYNPISLQKRKIYEDKDASFEKALFVDYFSAGIRRFEAPVFKVYFPRTDFATPTIV